jgi:hypothetical protein
MQHARGEVWLFDLGVAAKTRPRWLGADAFSGKAG